jgi:hypothetical protein
MAITIFNDGDITVATIAERNTIPRKFEGMQVTVLDATADATLGSGRACYQWDSTNSSWGLVWSDAYNTLQFSTENKVISNGQVTADNIPADGKVWQCRIIDPVDNTIISDARPTVSLGVLDLGTLDYDGKELEFVYAYGSISSQLQVLFDAFQQELDALEVGVSTTQEGRIDTLELSKADKSDTYTKAETDAKIVELAPTNVSAFTNDSGYQTAANVNSAIQAIVGAAPAALDTLAEIAAQLENDQDAVSALTTVVSGKANSSDVGIYSDFTSSFNSAIA